MANSTRARTAHWARWRVSPYCIWREPSGAWVVADRCYRPICRRFVDGTVEIAPSDEWIDFDQQEWIYRGANAPRINGYTRRRISEIVARLGLTEEIQRRVAVEAGAARGFCDPLPRGSEQAGR